MNFNFEISDSSEVGCNFTVYTPRSTWTLQIWKGLELMGYVVPTIIINDESLQWRKSELWAYEEDLYGLLSGGFPHR